MPHVDYHLVLRKWFDVHPGSEFRCFVRNKNLVGNLFKFTYELFLITCNFCDCLAVAISQRDDSQFHPFIGPNKEDIIKDITSFYKEQILPKFPLDSYVMDVYRSKKDSVYLIDFNPYGITTDAILFDWNEEPLTVKDPAESTEG